MYLDFYQLKKAPFHITPDPDFLFLSPSHKAALGAIIYGIEERQGFVAITGEVGLGKTTILRAYLERIEPRKLRTIYVFNANVSFRSLLKIIFQEFGLDLEDIVLFEDEDLFELVNRLHQALIQEYKQGRNVALIIDEAQHMPIETLENLRMLSNLETATEKLVQIVLIGQPEFAQKLDLHELRQLKQRLVIQSTIAPLTAAESMAYLQHRLAKVTQSPEPIFTKGALQRIVEAAHGTPRTMNILCTNALIAGYGYRQRPITAETVREVIGELAEKKSRSRLRPVFVGVVVVLLAAGLLLASPYGSLAVSFLSQHLSPHLPPWLAALQITPPPEPDPMTALSSAGPRPSFETAGAATTSTADDTNQTPDKQESTRPPDRSEVGKDALAIPAETASRPEVAMTEAPLIWTMNKGDSLSKIATEVYGLANDATLDFIKKHNPHIQDVNKVVIGTRVVLPKAPRVTP
jgi:general secretion pathway protein A